MFQDREENLESFENYLASSGNEGQAGNGGINYNKNVETIQFSWDRLCLDLDLLLRFLMIVLIFGALFQWRWRRKLTWQPRGFVFLQPHRVWSWLLLQELYFEFDAERVVSFIRQACPYTPEDVSPSATLQNSMQTMFQNPTKRGRWAGLCSNCSLDLVVPNWIMAFLWVEKTMRTRLLVEV